MSKDFHDLNELFKIIKTVSPDAAKEIQQELLTLSGKVHNVACSLAAKLEQFVKEKDFEMSHVLVDTIQEIQAIQDKLDVQIDTLDTFVEKTTTNLGVPKVLEETQALDIAQLELELESASVVVNTDIPRVNPSIKVYPLNRTTLDLKADFAGHIPVAFSIWGKETPTKTWKELFIKICEILAGAAYHRIHHLAEIETLRGQKLVYLSTKPDDMRRPRQLSGTDIYIETALKANQVRDLVLTLLSVCSISENEFFIYVLPKTPMTN